MSDNNSLGGSCLGTAGMMPNGTGDVPVIIGTDATGTVPNVSLTNAELEQLAAENLVLRAGLQAIADLIADSYGVAGLHLNGDVAPWAELRTGGRFEAWLLAFDDAMCTVRKEP